MVLSLLTKFRFSPNILLGFLYKVDHLLTGSEGKKKKKPYKQTNPGVLELEKLSKQLLFIFPANICCLFGKFSCELVMTLLSKVLNPGFYPLSLGTE